MLDQLLDRDLSCDASTTRGLTNHLPMALVAKAGLGAPLEELVRFSTTYGARLRIRGAPGDVLTDATWQRSIDEPAAYPELADFFCRQIDARGVDEVLRAYLPRFVSGLSGAAFHGAIRLSYALDAASARRVGAAMGYFAANAASLAPLGAADAETDDPADVLRGLAEEGEGTTVPSMARISDEMRWVARQLSFARCVATLSVDGDAPRRMAEVAVKLYATTDDFTALHGVTGLEALARLRGFVEDHGEFDRYCFQALAAAYVSLGAPPIWSKERLGEFAMSTDLERGDVARRGAMSDDEHVAKLVFTAQRLGVVMEDPPYRAVAERAVRNDTTSPEAAGRGHDA